MRDERFAGLLDSLQSNGLYRSRRVVESVHGPELRIDGAAYLNFCSNDYLGLAQHPALVLAFRNAAERYGVGAGAAHLVTGHTQAHHALEDELAEFTGRPRALLFGSGYLANLGVIAALVQRGESVFEDRLNHASLLDGGLLSGARLRRYPHANVAELARLLDRTNRAGLIVTDGVFSMDGDVAPLPELAAEAGARGIPLMMDDAHGLGVLGPGGRGCTELFGLDAKAVPILIGTLGKAFGAYGGFVAGSAELIEYLIQRARSYIYTTALPAAVAAAVRVALRIADRESWRREHLARLVVRFRTGAEQLGLPLAKSDTPIQPLVLGDSHAALAASRSLRDAGFLVSAIRPPTVPAGTARLRVTLSAAHQEEQVDRLLEACALAMGRSRSA